MVDRIADAEPTERLDQIAEDTGCAADVVQVLYRDEYDQLRREARISSFIQVLALKRVRDVLQNGERDVQENSLGGN